MSLHCSSMDCGELRHRGCTTDEPIDPAPADESRTYRCIAYLPMHRIPTDESRADRVTPMVMLIELPIAPPLLFLALP